MKIGIFGGSFNPVHIGHLMLAGFLQRHTELDEVWLTLSPLNPLKSHAEELLPDPIRLEMVETALSDTEGLKACDIELTMPKPSYTINTLRHLAEVYPQHSFKLIIGSDNWEIFDRWKESDAIISEFGVIVYPRPGYPIDEITIEGVELANAPLADISSTFIRQSIAQGTDVGHLLPTGVFEYIKQHKLYGA